MNQFQLDLGEEVPVKKALKSFLKLPLMKKREKPREVEKDERLSDISRVRVPEPRVFERPERGFD